MIFHFKKNYMKHVLKAITLDEVYLDGERLTPGESQKIINHSPDGFQWGYGGSGPSQLALAVFVKLTGKPGAYQKFKWDVIAKQKMGQPFEVEFELDDE